MLIGGKTAPPSVNTDKADTVIGKGTSIEGKITSSGLMRINGKFQGELHHNGDIVVGESGVVRADKIKARHITVAGEVRGKVEADGKLEIVSGGKVFGDITVGGLIIAAGTIFEGSSAMKGEGSQPASPRDNPKKGQ